MPAPIGAIVKLYYDSPCHLREGDYLQTHTGRTYWVRSVRLQARGDHVGRKHVRAMVVDETDAATDIAEHVEIHDGPRIHPICWYKR